MTEFSGAQSLRQRVDMVCDVLDSEIAITFSNDCFESQPLTTKSFSGFGREVRRTTAQLLSAGIMPGDVVAAFLPLTPLSYQTLLAAMLIGTVAPLNYFLEADALVQLLKQVKATTLITPASADEDPAFPEKVETIRRELPDLRLVVFGGGRLDGTAIRLQEVEGAADAEWLSNLPRDVNRNMVLMLTGGTTGKPKIVPHTEAMYLALFEAGAHAQGTVRGERILSGLPLFHTSGTLNAGLIPLMAGASIIIPSGKGYRDPEVARRFWDLVTRHRITVGAAVPTVLAAFASSIPSSPVSGLKYILAGGAPLPQSAAEQIRERTGASVVNGWGMTETCGFAVLNPLADPRIETVGLPFDCIEAEVRLPASDGELNTLAQTDQIGELVVRGATVIKQYLDDHPDAFTADGWLRTGDLARLDGTGHLTITGRRKDLIIRGGHNIDPAIIENAAYRHPAVELAAAIGRPDSYAGEIPILFVQPRRSVELDAEELLEFMRPLIPERAAVPKAVHVVEAIPLSGPGKISKLALRREATRSVYQGEADRIAGPAKIIVTVRDDARHGTVAELSDQYGLPADTREEIDAQLKQYSVAACWTEGPSS